MNPFWKSMLVMMVSVAVGGVLIVKAPAWMGGPMLLILLGWVAWWWARSLGWEAEEYEPFVVKWECRECWAIWVGEEDAGVPERCPQCASEDWHPDWCNEDHMCADCQGAAIDYATDTMGEDR